MKPETIDPNREFKLHLIRVSAESAIERVLIILQDIGELMWKRDFGDRQDPPHISGNSVQWGPYSKSLQE